MSWLVNSIANSLKLDDDDSGPASVDSGPASVDDKRPPAPDDQDRDLSPSDEDADRRGVKEDLSELSKTLTRQFWGVASFLAPPPQVSDPDSRASQQSEEIDRDGSDSDPDGVSGFRSDLSEIGGRFRAGILKLSGNKAVSELSKVASSILQFGTEESQSIEDYAQQGIVGVTEEVVAFARDVAMHPETWLDFPLPDEEEEEDEEFDMSDAQQEHALAVERLAPTLAALRIELCPGYMSEGCFWKIYFVLVHPRLSRDDAVLLSSPQIMKARAMLTNDLKTRVKSKPEVIEKDTTAAEATTGEQHLLMPSTNNPTPESTDASATQPETSKDAADIETDKHPVSTIESPVIDKQMVEETSSAKTNTITKPTPDPIDIAEDYDEDGDDWLKEEPSDMGGTGGAPIPLDDNEDVSFSDLEDDDDDAPIKKVVYPPESSKAEESDSWLDTKDIDVA